MGHKECAMGHKECATGNEADTMNTKYTERATRKEGLTPFTCVQGT